MAYADFSLRPLGSLPFQAQDEISPGKNAVLLCTTARSTQLLLDHKSFGAMCPLALIGHASYLVLVHRLTDSLHTSFPRSVTLPQLCFTSFAVVSSREDLHLQDCAHAGRTHPPHGLIRGIPVNRPLADQFQGLTLHRTVTVLGPNRLCVRCPSAH